MEGKHSETYLPFTCIHALEAIFKPNGSIRPITDSKRPIGLSINNSMDRSCYTFKYSNIDTVCQLLNPDYHFSVTDFSDAYRSVNIYPSHVYL